MVLNRIVEQIESVCNSHQKVNEFIYGDDEVIHGQDQREYILAWLSFGDQSFTLSNDNNNMVKLNFTLWILDKINNEQPNGSGYDSTNVKTIFDETLTIGLNILNELRNIANKTNYQVQGVSATPIHETGLALLAGMRFDLEIDLPLTEFCVMPFND